MTENKTNKPKQIEEGKRLRITITHEGMKGDGITKIEGFTIITKKAERGKTYEIEIIAVYATYAFARILREIKEKNKDDEEEQEAI